MQEIVKKAKKMGKVCVMGIAAIGDGAFSLCKTPA
jgi:hypothetical protein